MSSRRQGKSAAAIIDPPRYVQNERGETVEVIVSIEDYERYLRTLAKHADWPERNPVLRSPCTQC